MTYARLRPVADLARRWVPAAALSATAHGALAAGLFGLAGLARPPVPEPPAPAVMLVDIVPGGAIAPAPAATSAPAARPASSRPSAPAVSSAAAGAPAYSGETMQHKRVRRSPPPLPAAKPSPPRRFVALPQPEEKPAPPSPPKPLAEMLPPQPVRSLAAGTSAKAAPATRADVAAPQSASLPTAPAYGAAAQGNQPPRYPDRARRRGIEGRVLLRVHVTPEGEAGHVEVLESSGHAMLDRAARRAVERWRFTPATLAGMPVAGAVEVPVTFRLTD